MCGGGGGGRVGVSVMYAPFLTIVLIWTSSLSIRDLFLFLSKKTYVTF